MQGQQFRGPVRSVAQVNGDGAQIHYHGESTSLAPVDPQMARECPQCRHLTWRYTKTCMHCSLDLETWDRRTTGWRGWLRRWVLGVEPERHQASFERVDNKPDALYLDLLAALGIREQKTDGTAPSKAGDWRDEQGTVNERR